LCCKERGHGQHDLNAAFLNSDFFSIGGMITGERFSPFSSDCFGASS
jgi:hypothetical protein